MRMKAYALVLLFAACSDDERFVGCNLIVPPPTGDTTTDHANVQTALASVEQGNVVCLHKGMYRFADELDLSFIDNIEIRGSSLDEGTSWDFRPQQHGSYGLQVTTVNGFKLSRIAVLNAHGDAIRVSESTGVTFSEVIVDWQDGPKMSNGPYGLYPVSCSHILIDRCHVSGAADAGIYVGQSDTIIVRDSEASGNVAGIEIENSTDAEVVGNWAHDNVGGILVFNLPGLAVRDGKRANVHHNRVENNNLDSFADPAGIVALVPGGTGMILLASDSNEIHDNYVANNRSVGLAVISWKVTMRQSDDPNYDFYPQSNYIHDNTFMHSGYDPPEGSIAAAFAAGTHMPLTDMAWDGYYDPAKTDVNYNNCFENNRGSSTNLDGPENFNHPSAMLPVCGMRTRLPQVNF
jgi:parallel beta-helix repeat protein